MAIEGGAIAKRLLLLAVPLIAAGGALLWAGKAAWYS